MSAPVAAFLVEGFLVRWVVAVELGVRPAFEGFTDLFEGVAFGLNEEEVEEDEGDDDDGEAGRSGARVSMLTKERRMQ